MKIKGQCSYLLLRTPMDGKKGKQKGRRRRRRRRKKRRRIELH
jgi:hypothetical protein